MTAAHAYRDGKITLTLLVKRHGSGYVAYREDTGEHVAFTLTEYGAQQQADLYLRGFMAGYDEGWEYAEQERTGHSGTSAQDGEARRDQRRRR